MKEKARQRSRRKAERSKSVLSASQDRPRIEIEAKDFGLTLTVSMMKSGPRKRIVPHWQFRQDGIVVLHWWPSKGTFWIPYGNRRGVAPDARSALMVTAGLIGNLEDAQS